MAQGRRASQENRSGIGAGSHHRGNNMDNTDRNRERTGSNAGAGENRNRGGKEFVDVDDVKVEKVILSFENVPIPAEMPKKKKRRKLL